MIEVLKPGAATTVQDSGRDGARALGVGRAGALDAFSAHVANLLVGNHADAALFEVTLAGPTLRFERAARIALTGADIDADVDGVALPGWRPIELPAGCVLRTGACRRGARAYLAVGGGLALPPVLGSLSTDLRGGFGGIDGRALRAGDRVPRHTDDAAFPRLAIAPWWIDPTPDVDLSREAIAHVMPGRDATTPADGLLAHRWHVARASDRQGLRLESARLALADRSERTSEPVAPGTVQLPPDGMPIVLLADAQTVGGYPRIAHVASADLSRMAQCRPGDVIRFAPIDRLAALARMRAQQQRLARIELAIAHRSGRVG